jgi:GNAT superfamily N-acetyltransferase
MAAVHHGLERIPLMAGDSLRPIVQVRPVDPHDAEGLAGFYARLSSESRRRRFLCMAAGLGDAQCRSLCTPDHDHREGFVAVLRTRDERDGLIVGHLCVEPASRDAVEVAVAVSDQFQGQGIGRRLFQAALDWALFHRVSTLVATAFADNTPVLRLLSSAPNGATIEPAEAGLVDIEIRLA